MRPLQGNGMAAISKSKFDWMVPEFYCNVVNVVLHWHAELDQIL